MTFKKHLLIALTAVAFLTSGAIASAQTTDLTGSTTTGTTGTTDTTGTAVTTATPGTPDTGAGGNAAANWAMLAVSGVIVIGGVGYLMSRRGAQRTDTR